MTISEIRAAVDAGLSVKYETDNYEVRATGYGEYRIFNLRSGLLVSMNIHNADPVEFFVEFSSPRLADSSDRLAWRNLEDIHLPSLTEDDAKSVETCYMYLRLMAHQDEVLQREIAEEESN